MSLKFIGLLVLELMLFQPVRSCAGGIGGSQFFTNPSLNMKFYPPTSWTYPNSNAITQLAYFPGQSLTLTDAQLRANGDLNSAVLAGLNTLQLPTVGIVVTPQYTPPMVNDCGKATGLTYTEGTQVGYEEGGAITKLVTYPTGFTEAKCIAHDYSSATPTDVQVSTPFIQQASVKIDGITLSEYQAQLLAAKVSQYLMLNSKVDFTEEITIN